MNDRWVKKACILVVFIVVFPLLLVRWPNAAEKQEPVDFYKGKVIEFYVASEVGGGIDRWARQLAPFLAKYSGARVIVENMAGGNGTKCFNYIQFKVKPDGLTLATHVVSSLGLNQLIGMEGLRYDLMKLSWIGQYTPMMRTTVSGPKFKSFDDLKNAKEPIKYATDVVENVDIILFGLLAERLGFKLNVIPGYRGTGDVMMAMLRNEVDLSSRDVITYLPYIEEGKMSPLLVIHSARDPRISKVPSLTELATGMESWEKELINFAGTGRAILGPPGMPKERVEFLKDCLKKAMDDPELLEIIKKQNDVAAYVPGDEVKGYVGATLEMPKEKKDQMLRIINKYK
jgi:tripartite-type tricarboxylate transporter receptor subunit TctC